MKKTKITGLAKEPITIGWCMYTIFGTQMTPEAPKKLSEMELFQRNKKIQPGITPKDQCLVLEACIDFKCFIAMPLCELNGNWEVGFLQTICKSERIAYYGANGTIKRHLKLDTSNGPLRDGEEGTLFFQNHEDLRSGQTVAVHDHDSPKFFVPVIYMGEPLHSTEGCDEFVTFLAFVHNKSKSVILLNEVKWNVNWKGTWNKDNWKWTPYGPSIDGVSEDNRTRCFTNIRDRQLRPFSTIDATAENFCSIKVNDGNWVPSKFTGEPKKHASIEYWQNSLPN